MNYLVICPKFVNNEDEVSTFAHGVAYVSASLKSVRDTVFTLNLNFESNPLAAIEDKILKHGIDCLIIGGTSMTYLQIKEVLTFVKKNNPQIVTIIGGGLVTASPETAMKAIPDADIGIVGEGELTIIEIADAIEKHLDLNAVKGILFRDEKGIIHKTADRGDIKDLDQLPFPDYDGFQYEKQVQNSHVAMICTSRSCPYNCTFCFHTCGKTYRSRSLDNVFSEIDYLVDKYDVKVLAIADELFVSNKKRIMEFCERIIPYHLKWTAQARVDGIDEEILKLMKASGCIGISYGLESASNDILAGMKKNTTIEQIERAFKMTREAQIKPFGNFLFGDRNETEETAQKTLEWYSAHPEFDCSFCRIIVLPGSELYKYALDSGKIADEIKYWDEGFPFTNLTTMSDEVYSNQYFKMIEAKKNKLWLPKTYHLGERDKTNFRINVTVKCDVCQTEFNVSANQFAWDDQKASLCPTCNQSYNTPLALVLKEELNDKLRHYLEHKKLYIYGMGLVTRRMLKICEGLNHPNVILIDSSQGIQEKGIDGKKVYSNDILNDPFIEDIVVGVTEFVNFTSISKMVNEMFPHVKKIYTIDEFLFSLID